MLAGTPRELPPEIDDPAMVPGAQRIRALAATDAVAPRNSLMARATTYAVLLPLAYRIVLLPATALWLVVAQGFGNAWAACLVAVLGFAGSLGATVWVLKVPDRRGTIRRVLLWSDAGFAVAAGLVVGQVNANATSVPWVYFTGTVALWTVARGVPSGLVLTALGIPLQYLMGADLAGVVGGTGMLLAAVATAVGVLVLVGLGTRLALAIGIRQGRTAERARGDRTLHDTVLQSLEVMAMESPEDETDPREQLRKLRDAARAQANQVRRGLAYDEDGSPAGLGAELAGLATEMARDGLRAQLVVADIPDDILPDVRLVAVRDAVREALRNTIKHAGTGSVVVRMEERDGGIAVITRDHGVGYDEGKRPAGFGVSNSMRARLAEVGGRCHIESWPGRGTRVTLWVPR
ncbi:sensor histidine kinase [Amycolatopsis xylanica]|uniref:sensor histidine kinase n=1 Tax=Amycolatopsis xylanica TaxID=589385 RepID=UPI001FE1457E|nr:ATP-binding protein [Amycolatopsis xylanica]